MPRITPISSDKFIKFLLKIGCVRSRQKGSHVSFHKPGLSRPIIVPAERELQVFIIRNNLRTLQMDHNEYLRIISDL